MEAGTDRPLLTRTIFGFYYELALIIGFAVPRKSRERSIIGKAVFPIRWLLFLVVALVLFWRIIFLTTRLSSTHLDYNWCMSLMHIQIGVQALTSLIVISVWHYYGHSSFMEMMTSPKQNIAISREIVDRLHGVRRRILIVFVSFAVCGALSTAQTFYHNSTTTYGPNNTKPAYRSSMFFEDFLYPVDVVVFLYSLLLSASAISLVIIKAFCVKSQYAAWNENLKRAKITPEVLSCLSSQEAEFVSHAKWLSRRTERIISTSVFTGATCFVLSTFLFSAYFSEGWFAIVVAVSWWWIAQLLINVPLKSVVLLHQSFLETKELLLLDESVWNDAHKTTATVMIARVEHMREMNRVFKAFSAETIIPKVYFFGTFLITVLFLLKNV